MLDWMVGIFDTFSDGLKSVLPLSPFSQFIEKFEDMPFLSYLNWFFPVGEAIAILQAWLVAIGLFYLYSIVLRWIKAIS